MSRINVVFGPLGAMFVTETGTRENAVGGVFLSETVVVPTQTAFEADAFANNAFQIVVAVGAGTWLSTAGLLSSLTKDVNGLARASIKTFGGLTP